MKDNSNRVVTLVRLGWLCFAVGLGGLFYNARAPAVAATVWMLTGLVLLACWKITLLRVWVLNVELSWLVLLHLTRLFAGVYFLVLCQRGQLPCEFARLAGGGGNRGVFLGCAFGVWVGGPSSLLSWRWLWLARCGLNSRRRCCLPRTHLD